VLSSIVSLLPCRLLPLALSLLWTSALLVPRAAGAATVGAVGLPVRSIVNATHACVWCLMCGVRLSLFLLSLQGQPFDWRDCAEVDPSMYRSLKMMLETPIDGNDDYESYFSYMVDPSVLPEGTPMTEVGCARVPSSALLCPWLGRISNVFVGDLSLRSGVFSPLSRVFLSLSTSRIARIIDFLPRVHFGGWVCNRHVSRVPV
jgi:hypothetical protein